MKSFVDALKEYVEANNGNIQGVAEELRVSVPTIKRWLDGKNLPHKILIPRIMDFMEGEE